MIAAVVAALAALAGLGSLYVGIPAVEHKPPHAVPREDRAAEIELGIRPDPVTAFLAPLAEIRHLTPVRPLRSVTREPVALVSENQVANKAAEIALAKYLDGKRPDAFARPADLRAARKASRLTSDRPSA